METQAVIQTPFHKGHTHFYDYIDSFPGLPEGQSLDDRQKQIQRSIKHQFINGNQKDAAEYLKIRNCFTFPEKKYVEFCLKERVGGISVTDAAKKLGIYKGDH